MSFNSILLCSALVVSLSVPAFCDPPKFTVVDLGSLGGSGSTVNAINDSGQIAGSSFIANDAATHPFLWNNGVMTDLGTLGGSNGEAFGMNSLAEVVGSAQLLGGAITHAFLFSGGTMHDLGVLPGFSNSVALGINDSSQVVGYSLNPGTNEIRAFLYSGGVMSDLGTLGGPGSFAQAINNSGQVVGQADLARGAGRHGFIYSGGVMHDLGTLGGNLSAAAAINDVGQVVGQAGVAQDASQHAFLFSDGAIHDLGVFNGSNGSSAAAINHAGQIVGVSLFPANTGRAFLFSSGVMLDLNDQLAPNSLPGGVSLFDAVGISASNQIVANSLSNFHAYLLTPIAPLSITSPISLPPGAVGVAYASVAFTTKGGAGGNRWSAVGLPVGLGIDPTTGVLSGTPALGTQGVFADATFSVRDAAGTTASVTLSLTINATGPPPPVITSVSPSTVAGSNSAQKFCTNGTFMDGPALRVRLAWPTGQVDLPEDVFNPNQLCVTFNFSIAIGNWTAQVINGDGQLSNIFLFPVVATGPVAPTHFSLPQFIFGGAWYSAIYLSNTTTAGTTVQLTFSDNAALPLFVPLVGRGSLFSRIVNLGPGATVVLEALNGGDVTTEGWADILLPPGVIGYGVFRQVVEGRPDQEALVPFTSESSQTAAFTYDDNLFTTAVAFLNPSNQQTTITVTAFGADGTPVGTAQIPLDAHTKSTNALKGYPGMAGIVGKQGRVVVSVPNGAVSIMALRFGGSAFTDIPVNDR